jgi:DNA primase
MVSPVEEIKNRLDIVQVVGEYIKLKKAGANYRAICPFHSEKKPSFFVSPARQIWKCFGCGRGGSVFNFVMEIEGVEFGDALRILARKTGVELKPIRPELKTKRQRLYQICELATKFFEKQLQKGVVGKKAKQYLFDRKISEESIKKWRLGYAPDTWRGLSDFLVSKGFSKDEIQRAGLAIKDEKGHFYDRFRGRIMFPIFDLSSQVVGFTGRVFENGKKREVTAKYLNTPNTLLYDKGRILYGLDKAKVEIRKKGFCILTEGNVDVILSSQEGMGNIVATSGTALTSFQLDILKRYSDKLFLGFDMDVAGETATKRGIDLAQQKGFDIKVLLMPEGCDPADLISQDVKKWQEVVDKAKGILDFYFETALAHFDKKTPEGKNEISRILLPVIKRIPNKIIRFHWIQRLARELGAREKDIELELDKIKTENRESEEVEVVKQRKTPKQALEDELLLLILSSEMAIKFLEKEIVDFLSAETVQIISLIQKHGLNFEELEKELSSALFEKVQLLCLEAEVMNKDLNVEEEIGKCLQRIKSLKIKQELKKLSERIKMAEERQDEIKIEKLSKEFKQLSEKLNQLNHQEDAKEEKSLHQGKD